MFHSQLSGIVEGKNSKNVEPGIGGGLVVDTTDDAEEALQKQYIILTTDR